MSGSRSSAVQGTDHTPPDLLTLARAPLARRLGALESVWSELDPEGPLPARPVQISGLIVAETIRLIRQGTTLELADSSLAVARALNRPEGRTLPQRHPEAYRLISGAAVALAAAAAPSSPAAGRAVLRSWNGKAEEAVRILTQTPGHSLARAELRARLGEPAESHLSHLLGDLEAAGLVGRIREGRNVTVHLGPAVADEDLQELIAPSPAPTWGPGSFERDPEISLASLITGRRRAASADRHFVLSDEDEIRGWAKAMPVSIYVSGTIGELGESNTLRFWDEHFKESYSSLGETHQDLHHHAGLVGDLHDLDLDH
jgi:hypothetical protein